MIESRLNEDEQHRHPYCHPTSCKDFEVSRIEVIQPLRQAVSLTFWRGMLSVLVSVHCDFELDAALIVASPHSIIHEFQDYLRQGMDGSFNLILVDFAFLLVK